MTPLRKRMIEDMKLYGFAQRTRETYLYAVSSEGVASPQVSETLRQISGADYQPTASKKKKSEPMRCPTCQGELIFIADVKPGGHWLHAPPAKFRLKENFNTVSILNEPFGG